MTAVRQDNAISTYMYIGKFTIHRVVVILIVSSVAGNMPFSWQYAI